jgi:hypothetical protein
LLRRHGWLHGRGRIAKDVEQIFGSIVCGNSFSTISEISESEIRLTLVGIRNLAPKRRRDHALGQSARQFLSGKLVVDQEHGYGELVFAEFSFFANISQIPKTS